MTMDWIASISIGIIGFIVVVTVDRWIDTPFGRFCERTFNHIAQGIDKVFRFSRR